MRPFATVVVALGAAAMATAAPISPMPPVSALLTLRPSALKETSFFDRAPTPMETFKLREYFPLHGDTARQAGKVHAAALHKLAAYETPAVAPVLSREQLAELAVVGALRKAGVVELRPGTVKSVGKDGKATYDASTGVSRSLQEDGVTIAYHHADGKLIATAKQAAYDPKKQARGYRTATWLSNEQDLNGELRNAIIHDLVVFYKAKRRLSTQPMNAA